MEAGEMRVLVIEHADHEGPGLLGDALVVRRAQLDVRRSHHGQKLPASLDGYHALVVMGGPMSAWEDERHPFLAVEARLLGEAARSGLLTLGVCLGAQLLARGLGARVCRGTGPELGLAPIALTDEGRSDELLRPFDNQPVLHWHGDTFDLPAGAVRLASSVRYQNQAFRYGRKCYGLQFHVECDAPMRRQWARLGESELRAAGLTPLSLSGQGARGLDERGRAFAAALFKLL